ncbi:thiamine-phosphate kinase [Sulfuriferula multivorans]|nr:thiamine-phosphate kinase [Sulfuriferula multivorans]
MPSEFDLIQRHFSRTAQNAVLGVGDDCALLQPGTGMQLAVSTDTLVADVHFFADADPQKLGWKCLAVNLSDLAAMGATPRWATLALTLPEVDDDWLAAFASGLYDCANQFGVSLVGGDTTHGALSLTLTIIGEVPPNQALRRDGARPGDEIWVSGTLGDAALALAALQGRVNLTDADLATLAARLHTPAPRIELGLALRGLASSAIDVSDGLLADLGHILSRSGVGAVVEYAHLPLGEILHDYTAHPAFDDCVLSGGDDYELCFTAPAAQHQALDQIAARLNLRLTAIGSILAEPGLIVRDAQGQPLDIRRTGYDHFAA